MDRYNNTSPREKAKADISKEQENRSREIEKRLNYEFGLDFHFMDTIRRR